MQLQGIHNSNGDILDPSLPIASANPLQNSRKKNQPDERNLSFSIWFFKR